jgi:hypothetical protein
MHRKLRVTSLALGRRARFGAFVVGHECGDRPAPDRSHIFRMPKCGQAGRYRIDRLVRPDIACRTWSGVRPVLQARQYG